MNEIDNGLAPLLSQKEAMRLLGVSAPTLQRWRRQGRGPRFIRLEGGGLRYTLQDLDAWVRARTGDSSVQLPAKSNSSASSLLAASDGSTATTAELARLLRLSRADVRFLPVQRVGRSTHGFVYNKAEVLAHLSGVNGRTITWPPEPLLRTRDAWEWLGQRGLHFHPHSLCGMRAKGRGPNLIKILPSRYRYDIRDLQRWLESRNA